MNTIVHMYIVKYTSGICSHINAYNCICAYVLCNWQFIWIVAVMGTFFQTRSRSTDCLVQSTSMTQAALRSEGIQSTSISNNSTSKFFIIIIFYLPNCLSLVTRFFLVAQRCVALRRPAFACWVSCDVCATKIISPMLFQITDVYRKAGECTRT